MKDLLKTVEERIMTLMTTQEDDPASFDDFDLGMLQAFLNIRTWIEQHQEEQNVVELRQV